MKQFLLLFNLFLLTIFPINLFSAESAETKATDLGDIRFEENYFTPEERYQS